jgi:hypothetical protein
MKEVLMANLGTVKVVGILPNPATLRDWFLNGKDGLKLEGELHNGACVIVEISSYDFEQLDKCVAVGAPVGARLRRLLPTYVEVPRNFFEC